MKVTFNSIKNLWFLVMGLALITLAGCPNIFSAMGGSGSGGGGGGGGGGGNKDTPYTPTAPTLIKPANASDAADILKNASSPGVPIDLSTVSGEIPIGSGETLNLNNTIIGGTINADSSNAINMTGDGTLDGTTLKNATINTNDDTLTIKGTTMLENSTLNIDNHSAADGHGLEVAPGGNLVLTGTTVNVTADGDVKVDAGGKLTIGSGSEVDIGTAGDAEVEILGNVVIESGGKLDVGSNTMTNSSLAGTVTVESGGTLELIDIDAFPGTFSGSIVYESGATATVGASPGQTLVSNSAGAMIKLTNGTLTQQATGTNPTYAVNGEAEIDANFRIGVADFFTVTGDLTVNSGKTLIINGTLTVDGTFTVTGNLVSTDDPSAATITFKAGTTVSWTGPSIDTSGSDVTCTWSGGVWTIP
jgi:hypothetical protein